MLDPSPYTPINIDLVGPHRVWDIVFMIVVCPITIKSLLN